MQVDRLKLINFRNFKERDFKFKKGINLIAAQNGMGKTNILESIRILSYGKPLFIEKESDTINFDVQKVDLSYNKIVMEWKDFEGEHESSYTLSPNIKPIKSIIIDGQRKQIKNFVGRFCTVWFSPETINVITASPRYRRELLDIYLSQLSPEYIIAFTAYFEALTGRNKFLKSLNGSLNAPILDKFDEVLAKRGAELIEVKYKLCNELKIYVDKNSQKQERYEIQWNYEPNIEKHPIFDENMEHAFKTHLLNSRQKDMILKRTNVGPHRDDWTIILRDKKENILYDLKSFGSRGQKRMGLLIFTLAVVDILENAKSSKPVLLLDDVISELDHENVGLILDILNNKGQQSIITSVSDQIGDLKNVNVIKL